MTSSVDSLAFTKSTNVEMPHGDALFSPQNKLQLPKPNALIKFVGGLGLGVGRGPDAEHLTG